MIRWELRLDSCGEAKAGRWGLVHQADEQVKDTWKVREGSEGRKRSKEMPSTDLEDDTERIQCGT